MARDLATFLDAMRPANWNEAKTKTIAMAGVYARQSTLDGQNAQSVQEQLDYIKMQLERGSVRSELYPNAKIQLCDSFVFKDEGITGRVERKREEFQRFKEAMINHEFDVALVYDLSRLGREVGSLVNLRALTEMTGVEIISVSEMLSSHSGIADESFVMKGLINQMYSKAISRQTKRALRLRANTGLSTGQLPYGYKSVPSEKETVNGELIPKGKREPANRIVCIDEEKAGLVRRIFDLYAHTDIGTDGIAKMLNQDGIPSPRGSIWGGSVIYGMLTQSKYTGVWIYGRTEVVRDPSQDKLIQKPKDHDWVVYESKKLSIITEEVWNDVQAKLKDIKKQKANTDNKSVSLWGKNRGQANHFFTGTMCCDECDGNFVVISGRRGGYMGCTNAFRKNTCSNKHSVRLAYVEQAMLKLIKGWLTDPNLAHYMCEQYNKKSSDRKKKKTSSEKDLTNELNDVQNAITNLVRFLASGNASDAVVEGLKQKEHRKKELLACLNEFKPQNEAKPSAMTPDILQLRLVNLDEILRMDIKRANQFFKRLFPKQMKMARRQKGKAYYYEAIGQLDLSRLIQKENSVPVLGAPNGSRTRITALRGRRPNH